MYSSDILYYKPITIIPTVNCPSQETEVTSTPTRPVENVVITTKDIGQKQPTVRWKDGGK